MAALILKWTARALSAASILLCLFILLGNGLDFSKFTAKEGILIAFFPLGVVIGLMLAWWKELTGALLAIGSLVLFYVAHLFASDQWPEGTYFLIITLPAFVFLLSWILSRSAGKSPSPDPG